MWREIRQVARRELAAFFGSPVAYLFLALFLAVTLFVFFWVETFFARNIADLQPLFRWMPLLLLFLVAALTMRAWAEERRAGTLELLVTAPVSPWSLVLGKFLAGWLLVALALLLTLPLPVSVAFLGPLDWGPVAGGYLAALFLAAAYLGIGLWASSRAESQIVALLLTVAVGGALYLAGAPAITGLVSYRAGEWLRAIGLGSRFEEIVRGVLDLGDLYYYVSIAALFLLLNRLELARTAWAGNPARPGHRAAAWLTALAAANLLAANLWIDQLGGLRLDLTQGRLYTLSDATRTTLARLREPLLIRGYFSAATHPLLAPLVPQLRDLLQEYAVAGKGRVRVEFVDPHDDPAVEEEAGSRFGIRPVPFRTANKYQASVVNSYFHVLVSYGDQYKVLGYQDLVDVKVGSETKLEVALRNPEYEITAAIRKVLNQYQGGGDLFATLVRPVTFTGYLSAALPKGMEGARKALRKALDRLQRRAGGRFKVRFEDPGRDQRLAKRLQRQEGFQPMILDLLDPHPFWFYMVLDDGRQKFPVPLPRSLDEEGFRKALEAGLKRFSPGFLKTLAVFAPSGATPSPLGLGSGGRRYSLLKSQLADSVRWIDTDLESGRLPADADMLLVLAPRSLDEKQRFAIDQFLMRGGTVLVAASPFDVSLEPSLSASKADSGLEEWLAGYGLKLGGEMVLDPRAGALPIPVERHLGGGFTVREIQLVDYPYILDVRDDGFNRSTPVTAGLDQLYVPFASPIEVEKRARNGRKVTWLLRSSAKSWTSSSLDIVPDFRRFGDLGFRVEGEPKARTLAVMLEGRFDSAFKGKRSPLLSASGGKQKAGKGKQAPSKKEADRRAEGVIERSADGARLILVASNLLFTDEAEALLTGALGTEYLKPALFAQNLVDWSLQDQALLALRGRDRSRFARTLEPMGAARQKMVEYGDYLLVLALLAVVWVIHRRRRREALDGYRRILQEV